MLLSMIQECTQQGFGLSNKSMNNGGQHQQRTMPQVRYSIIDNEQKQNEWNSIRINWSLLEAQLKERYSGKKIYY